MYGLYILFYIQILSFYCWPAQSETEAIPISDADYAIQFHEYAMKLIFENENYQDALHYFRAAVRMKPKESLYLNDLGVTEMRMVRIEVLMCMIEEYILDILSMGVIT